MRSSCAAELIAPDVGVLVHRIAHAQLVDATNQPAQHLVGDGLLDQES